MRWHRPVIAFCNNLSKILSSEVFVCLTYMYCCSGQWMKNAVLAVYIVCLHVQVAFCIGFFTIKIGIKYR